MLQKGQKYRSSGREPALTFPPYDALARHFQSEFTFAATNSQRIPM